MPAALTEGYLSARAPTDEDPALYRDRTVARAPFFTADLIQCFSLCIPLMRSPYCPPSPHCALLVFFRKPLLESRARWPLDLLRGGADPERKQNGNVVFQVYVVAVVYVYTYSTQHPELRPRVIRTGRN
ncbi:hypothetical protein MTO96_000064 [Rhipicephalus appendiculatus]